MRDHLTQFFYMTTPGSAIMAVSKDVESPTIELRRRGNRGTITNVAKVK